MFKYSKRGFAVAVPNLDKSRVDTRLFSKDFREVAGLAKLVLYDFKQGPKSGLFSKARAKVAEQEVFSFVRRYLKKAVTTTTTSRFLGDLAGTPK